MNKYDILALALIIAIPLLLGLIVVIVGSALSDFVDKTKGSD